MLLSILMTSLNSAPVIRFVSSSLRLKLLLSLTCFHSPESFTSSTSSLQPETVQVRRVVAVATAACQPRVTGVVVAARKVDGLRGVASMGEGAGAGGEAAVAGAKAEAIFGGEGAADGGATTETGGSLEVKALIG